MLPTGEAFALSEYGSVFFWNGSSWSQLPAIGVPVFAEGVWASSATDAWVVGGSSGNTALISHWNGTTWSQLIAAPDTFNAVWGTGPNDVWFVGDYGRIRHWDGTTLSTTASGTTFPHSGLGFLRQRRLGCRLLWEGRSLGWHCLVGRDSPERLPNPDRCLGQRPERRLGGRRRREDR